MQTNGNDDVFLIELENLRRELRNLELILCSLLLVMLLIAASVVSPQRIFTFEPLRTIFVAAAVVLGPLIVYEFKWG